jgi:TPR repeat protein
MATLDIDRLKAMSAEEISALLSPGHPERPIVIQLAAEAGLADAQAALGQMLLDGDGVRATRKRPLAGSERPLSKAMPWRST